MLTAAGWVVQDYRAINLYAGDGVAVRELRTDAGPADYVLFVNRQAVGVIEAKKQGTPLSGVEWQTVKYQASIPEATPSFLIDGRLPFGYEATGSETWFTCQMDPQPTARRVFAFHRPETLEHQVTDLQLKGRGALRARIPHMPPLEDDPHWLRNAQAEAIRNLDDSLKANHQRALIQMATGSGKTFCAANICERLLSLAGAERILFLVDRGNLGIQTYKELQGFDVPGTGRKFTELYNVQHLRHNRFDPVASVCIGTIQRVYSMLRGEAEVDPELDERSGYEIVPQQPMLVDYNPELPIEAFDVIIVDECHRSIYGVWRQVLEYFDAFLIGLTATPGKQTFGFFNRNLVMECAMTWGTFRPEENKAIPQHVHVDPGNEIHEGDLLLSRANTSALVGASVLVGACRPRLLLSDKSMRLVAKPGIDKRWLRYALASPALRRQMSLLATGTSDSMRNISQAKVRGLTLRVPPEQQQVGDRRPDPT